MLPRKIRQGRRAEAKFLDLIYDTLVKLDAIMTARLNMEHLGCELSNAVAGSLAKMYGREKLI